MRFDVVFYAESKQDIYLAIQLCHGIEDRWKRLFFIEKPSQSLDMTVMLVLFRHEGTFFFDYFFSIL
jgi:hypothetical protein